MKAIVKRSLPPAPEPTRPVRIDENPQSGYFAEQRKTNQERREKAQKEKQTQFAPRKWTPQDDARMIRMYENGTEIKKIAIAFDVHRNTIRRRLDKLLGKEKR